VHFWNPNQKTPATEWEKQIDDLMAKQGRTFDMAERKRLFDEVQRVFVEHQPILYFAAQRFNVSSSTRLVNVKPALHWTPILWNADELAVR
jgi:peptide/nickel transport system substrate-binding protein